MDEWTLRSVCADAGLSPERRVTRLDAAVPWRVARGAGPSHTASVVRSGRSESRRRNRERRGIRPRCVGCRTASQTSEPRRVAAATLSFSRELRDDGGPRRDVARRDQPSRLSVDERFRNAAVARTEHRKSVRLCFDEHAPERLASFGRQRQQIHRGVRRRTSSSHGIQWCRAAKPPASAISRSACSECAVTHPQRMERGVALHRDLRARASVCTPLPARSARRIRATTSSSRNAERRARSRAQRGVRPETGHVDRIRQHRDTRRRETALDRSPAQILRRHDHAARQPQNEFTNADECAGRGARKARAERRLASRRTPAPSTPALNTPTIQSGRIARAMRATSRIVANVAAPAELGRKELDARVVSQPAMNEIIGPHRGGHLVPRLGERSSERDEVALGAPTAGVAADE